ncbi:MAG: dienelactone hydrolase family protein [Ignavibacteria bacterium]|nr:dienelactone hydrolase family protein [Ignavibacteria bacterium]
MNKILLLFFVILKTNVSVSQQVPSDSGSIQYVGNRTITFIDSSRNNRSISSLVYYPATSEGSNAPVLSGNKYPLISFGHGFTLNPNLYVALYRHLASWGYIVIAPSTETGFSPNHLNFAKDLVFVLKDMKRKGRTSGDLFFGVADSVNTGVFGHSMGGGCSFLAGSLDSTLKAVSSLAAANTNPSSISAASLVKCPVQLLSGQRDSIASYSSQQIPHYNNSFPFKHIGNIKGGNHSQFHLIPGLDDLVDNAATITRAEQQRLTRRYLTSFFNLFLKNDSGSKKFLYGDIAQSDTGIIMQYKNFQLTALIQGFYNEVNNTMISDTVKIYLKNTSPPFQIIDSSKSVLNNSGYGTFDFLNADGGAYYYIHFSHRNSLETWSKAGGELFSLSNFVYDFTTNSSKAFGSNMIQKGSEYCIYNGDINSDGITDLTDLTGIYNDVVELETGYLKTDINGDNTIDLSDLIIVFNNVSNFITRIVP